MAAFSQKSVTPEISVERSEWRADEFDKLNPWELWNLDATGCGVRIAVNYEHWDGGSNGYSTYLKFENGHLESLVP